MLRMFVGMIALAFSVGVALHASDQVNMEAPPEFLYKVISAEQWQRSQDADEVVLSSDDADFIHLSRKDQLERIIDKYWGDQPVFVVLKLDRSKLRGNLVLEANPGGINKYYHLYQGFIPLEAVIGSEIITRYAGLPSDAASYSVGAFI